jgi:hypothetical protein
MLLVLRDPSRPDAPVEVDIGHLLGKAGKDGKPSVRGPLADGAEGTPLAALRDGDKLHIVAAGDRRSIAGLTPEALVKHLGALGLGREVRLDQIHLLADEAGTGGEASYAQRFADALASEGYAVQEIKAPRGAIRTAPGGKVLVKPSPGDGALAAGDADPDGYQPSKPALNHYAGPAIKDKHRR